MPKGVYDRSHLKPRPRIYPTEIVELVQRLYIDEGMTVLEVQAALPKGYKAQRIIERHIPKRRPSAKRNQSGPANTSWKGDDLGYDGAHMRVQSQRGKAAAHSCVDCGNPAHDWSYRGGCPRERRDQVDHGCAYSPDPSMYDPRCRSCHRRYDIAMRRGEVA